MSLIWHSAHFPRTNLLVIYANGSASTTLHATWKHLTSCTFLSVLCRLAETAIAMVLAMGNRGVLRFDPIDYTDYKAKNNATLMVIHAFSRWHLSFIVLIIYNCIVLQFVSAKLLVSENWSELRRFVSAWLCTISVIEYYSVHWVGQPSL